MEADADEADADVVSPASPPKRRMCQTCTRPESACICASLPSTPLRLPSGLESILLLRHPKERRQKHQSAWILERCLSSVRQHVCRKLPTAPSGPDAESAPGIPSGLEYLYEQPDTCLLVFPGTGAKPLRDVLDPGVKHLILVDATWRFAREMAAVEEAGPLSQIRRVELTPPHQLRPVFVVRKPMVLTKEEAEPAQWGFSTAEAAALAVDEIAHLRGRPDAADPADADVPGEAWELVTRALRAYAQIQLEHTEAPRMRSERPGFIPRLYDNFISSSPAS